MNGGGGGGGTKETHYGRLTAESKNIFFLTQNKVRRKKKRVDQTLFFVIKELG